MTSTRRDQDSLAFATHVRAHAGARRRNMPRVESDAPGEWQITSRDFPFGVAEELARLRDEGFDFDRAWARIDADRRARDAGFTWKSREGHVEASLPFAKRHFRAAFENESPHSYCVVTTCVELTCDEYGLCDVHATYREATAA